MSDRVSIPACDPKSKRDNIVLITTEYREVHKYTRLNEHECRCLAGILLLCPDEFNSLILRLLETDDPRNAVGALMKYLEKDRSYVEKGEKECLSQ